MSDYQLLVDELGVELTHPEIPLQFVAWDDLQQVSFVTNDKGPFEDDVFLVLEGSNSRVVIPQGMDNVNKVLDRVTKLDGFNFEAMIAAMSSTENAKFICWKKS